MMTKSNKAQLAMVATVFLWSTGGVLIKLIPWNAQLITGLRSLIAVIMLIIYLKQQKLEFSINRFSFFTALGLYGNFYCYVTAAKITTATNAIMLSSTHPIFIIIMAAFIFKQKPTKKQIIAITGCFIGICLFFIGDIGTGAMYGNLLALAAGLMMAVVHLSSTKNTSRDSALSGLILGHLLTAVINTPLGLMAGDVDISYLSVIGIIFMGVLQTGLAYILYNYASQNISAFNCSLISMIEPLINPLWVFIIVGEVPTMMAVIGGTIVTLTVSWWCIYSASLVKNNMPTDIGG